MDAMTLRERLAQSGRDIAFFELLVARQFEVLASLERSGQDATEVRKRLAQLECAQMRHCENRARLIVELAQATMLISIIGPKGAFDVPGGRERPMVPSTGNAFPT